MQWRRFYCKIAQYIFRWKYQKRIWDKRKSRNCTNQIVSVISNFLIFLMLYNTFSRDCIIWLIENCQKRSFKIVLFDEYYIRLLNYTQNCVFFQNCIEYDDREFATYCCDNNKKKIKLWNNHNCILRDFWDLLLFFMMYDTFSWNNIAWFRDLIYEIVLIDCKTSFIWWRCNTFEISKFYWSHDICCRICITFVSFCFVSIWLRFSNTILQRRTILI